MRKKGRLAQKMVGILLSIVAASVVISGCKASSEKKEIRYVMWCWDFILIKVCFLTRAMKKTIFYWMGKKLLQMI